MATTVFDPCSFNHAHAGHYFLEIILFKNDVVTYLCLNLKSLLWSGSFMHTKCTILNRNWHVHNVSINKNINNNDVQY